MVSGWHIDQARRQIQARVGNPRPAPNRSTPAPSSIAKSPSPSHGNPLVGRHRGESKTGEANKSDPAIARPLVTDEVAGSVPPAVVHEVPVDGGLLLVQENLDPLVPAWLASEEAVVIPCSPAMVIAGRMWSGPARLACAPSGRDTSHW